MPSRRPAAPGGKLPWIDTRLGVRQERIWEDTVNARRAILARFEPGATPPHRHVGDELIFIVEGANAAESGQVVTGHMNYRLNPRAPRKKSASPSVSLESEILSRHP